MSHIRRVHDPNKEKDAKKDDRKVEEFSVGGAQSTTAVLRPIRDRDDDNALSALAINAKKKIHEDGNTEDVPSAGVTITIYSNGFFVGDGPFRDADVPTNRLFLSHLLKQEVPPELEKQINGEASTSERVKIELVNRSTETYTAPPQPFSFSTSQGFSLADGPQPTDSIALSQLPGAELQVDSTQPTGVVMIQLANGQRSRLTVNMATTVTQLYQHVRHLTGSDETRPFSLTGGFPPKDLSDGSATVEALKLKGCVINQKFI